MSSSHVENPQPSTSQSTEELDVYNILDKYLESMSGSTNKYQITQKDI